MNGNTSNFPRLLRPKEAAVVLGMSEQTVRYYLRSGILPGVRVGVTWRIADTELQRWIASGGAGLPRNEATTAGA